MIYVKDKDVLLSLSEAPAHPVLQRVMAWLCDQYPEMVCITSGYRDGDNGVHGTNPCRARDIRSSYFQQPKAIERQINEHWQYDPDRPWKQVALWHDAGSGNHFHIQVCDKTHERINSV